MIKKIKCPECNDKMNVVEIWDSINGIGNCYKYICETCGGVFQVKRAK